MVRLFVGVCFPLLSIFLAASFETSMLPLTNAKGREKLSQQPSDPLVHSHRLSRSNLFSLPSQPSLSLSPPPPPPIPPKTNP